MRLHGFRSLLAAFGGAFLLLGPFVPKADADLIAYFNFEDATLGGAVDRNSDAPPGAQSPTLMIAVSGLPAPTTVGGVPLNVAPGDLDPNNFGAGFVTTTGGTATISFTVNTIGLTNLSLSFAVSDNGNGFSTATFFYKVDAGSTTLAGSQMIHSGAKSVVTFDFSSITAVNNQSSVTFSVVFSGGTSMGQNLQTVIDNIQLTAVPEPATAASAVLAAFGLCWFQRYWLIRFALLRRSYPKPGRLHRALR